MIIVDKDIKKLIHEGSLVIISGESGSPFSTSQIGPGSIDLRVNNVFRKYKPEVGVIDLNARNDTEIFEIAPNNNILIQPREILITTTLESVILPANIAGIITGRSSIARMGLLVQVSQDYVQPGQAQAIGLQLVNVTDRPIRIEPFSAICQIALFYTTSRTDTPYGNRKVSKYKEEYVAPLPALAIGETANENTSDNIKQRELQLIEQINEAKETILGRQDVDDFRSLLSRMNSAFLVILGGMISVAIAELDVTPFPSTTMIISSTMILLCISLLVTANWKR